EETARPTVVLGVLKPNSRTPPKLHVIDAINDVLDSSRLVWSPQGNQCVIIDSARPYAVRFFDANLRSVVGQGEHAAADIAKWDPSGRYFLTSSVTGKAMSNTYILWSHVGNEVFSSKEKKIQADVYTMDWRPIHPRLAAVLADSSPDAEARRGDIVREIERADQVIRLSLAGKDTTARRERRQEWLLARSEWERYVEENASQIADMLRASAAVRLGNPNLSYVTESLHPIQSGSQLAEDEDLFVREETVVEVLLNQSIRILDESQARDEIVQLQKMCE
ncbi:hypothetical protein KIPB_012381, partial [Kipferlia bialata]